LILQTPGEGNGVEETSEEGNFAWQTPEEGNLVEQKTEEFNLIWQTPEQSKLVEQTLNSLTRCLKHL
jgi:hypothetical protein